MAAQAPPKLKCDFQNVSGTLGGSWGTRLSTLREFVFLSLAVVIDEVPDRLTQLSVFERPIFGCRHDGTTEGLAVDNLAPAFEHKHSTVAERTVKYLADVSMRQVDVVDHLGEFLSQANAQNQTQSADHCGAGELPISDSHIYYVSVFRRQAECRHISMCIS
jgi:hypothetical protein